MILKASNFSITLDDFSCHDINKHSGECYIYFSCTKAYQMINVLCHNKVKFDCHLISNDGITIEGLDAWFRKVGLSSAVLVIGWVNKTDFERDL